MGSSRQNVRALVKFAEELGCTVEQTKGNGHFKIKKDGRLVSVISGSPSDHRSLQNSLADIRRGVDHHDNRKDTVNA